MCGIAIQYQHNFLDFSRINHRGIEMEAMESGDYTIFHTRLPLQTEQGDEYQQPIKLPNGDVLVYNGEIFNFPEGFENDVEYLIHFFSQENWKYKLLDGEADFWDGFWAICVVDDRGIWAFTDPLGKKQLYHRNGGLCSEIKPFLNTEHKSFSYEWSKVKRTKDTPFWDVFRLWPNKLYRITGKVCSFVGEDIWNLRKKRSEPSNTDILEIIQKSVMSRTVNRLDNNSIFVSGGLDSTIILSHFVGTPAMENLDLLTISNDEDEEYIKVIEDWAGVEVRRVGNLQPHKRRSAMYHYEHPLDLGSLFPQYKLCSESKGSVIYTGDGADELFSGYNRAQTLDTQEFDIFTELPFYHNIRLDRMGMAFTKEIRSPFMSHDLVRAAWNIPWSKRHGKQTLKDIYWRILPKQIVERKKIPLRDDQMRKNRYEYLRSVHKLFTTVNFHE